MSIETDDTNYADIENIESIEGIIKIGNSGAPSISDLSPNSDWRSFPPSSYNCCYGLPYQDHNYGAPPPPTPPPSPGSNALVTKNKTFEIALKSLKPNKVIPERRAKAPIKRQAIRRRNGTNSKTANKPVGVESKAEVSTDSEHQENGEVLASGDYSDSITRCICNFTHDDGYMICCDQCQVWQHIDCMGIDRADIPDEYSCEQCMPRQVHKARARLIQKKKRVDILRSSKEVENSNNTKKKAVTLLKVAAKHCNKKMLSPVKKDGVVARSRRKATVNTVVNRKGGGHEPLLLSVDGDTEEFPWNAIYEQASNNQYSTDIEECLKSYKPDTSSQLVGVVDELKKPKCQLRLLANGHRCLEIGDTVGCGDALIEFRGKMMLQQQFEQENNFLKRPQPFVLFYKNWDCMQICMDATSFGNEARFVRRSCAPNSEVRHLIEKGKIHLVLFAVKDIADGCEVTIPFDYDYKFCEYDVECACSKTQCPVRKAGRNVKKRPSLDKTVPNGETHSSSTKQAAIKQTPIKQTPIKQTPIKQTPIKQTPSKQTPSKRAVSEKLKLDIPSNHFVETDITTSKSQSGDKLIRSDGIKSPANEKAVTEEARRLSREDRKIEAYMKAFEKMEKREEKRKELLQKSIDKKETPNLSHKMPETAKESKQPATVSAQKHRNQHNKTATNLKTTSLHRAKNTPKVQAAKRKRNRSGPALRRRTVSSTATSDATTDTELDENSNCKSDESTCQVPLPGEVGSTATGTVPSSETSFRFPKTKKHLLIEWYNEKGLDKPLTVSVSQSESMDFVKTNSSPGSSWAHLRRNSITGSNQPTNTAQSNTTPVLSSRKLDISMGSAKKRWLKQAMEEDSSNHVLLSPCSEQTSTSLAPSMVGGNPAADLTSTPVVTSHTSTDTATTSENSMSTSMSPNHTAIFSAFNHSSDFVTPLKKRRVARESVSLDSWPASPDQTTVPEASQTKFSPMSPLQEFVNRNAQEAVKKETLGEDEFTVNCRLLSPQRADIKLETIHEGAGDASYVKNPQYKSNVDVTEESGPMTENSASASPIPAEVSSIVLSNESPALVGDVFHEQISSPLIKHQLLCSKNQDDVNSSSKILSPREPRTLIDMMQQIPSSSGEHEVTSPKCKTSMESPIKRLSPALVEVAASANNQYPLQQSLKGEASVLLQNHNSFGGSSTAARLLNLSHPPDMRRAVSLVDDAKPRSSLWNEQEDFEGNLVHDTLNQESCGSADFAPITPPSKKKVSLLEYRKRMQIQPPKPDSFTSASAPTTPLSNTSSLATKHAAPVALPALPLFADEIDSPMNMIVAKAALSLDERLKLEFGFASSSDTEKHEGNSKGRDTPPPPPPPPTPPSIGKNLAHTITDLGSSRISLDEEAANYSHVTRDSCEIVVDSVDKPSETNGDLSSGSVEKNHQYSSPQDSLLVASPLQQGNVDSIGSVSSKKPTVPLKQGSLGAVMLGQSLSSPIANREISGSRQIAQFDLPKKYR
ncbi:inactive histone-lysine N-methyltransferase 2E-like isoform X2 [Watersipora subatra]|uniref:inactive histone-lysine N-methyltransferase 2E-like isoform X2 n=1 Tax=Watersipora subatra TaxID=2589382 RepID=UPI00355BDC1A